MADPDSHTTESPVPARSPNLTPAEARTVAFISLETEPEALLRMAKNASGRSPTVEQAALRRLAGVSAGQTPGTVEQACWEMVHAVEGLRRLNGRKVWRMHRMRPKIARDGEVGALEYCALDRTDGFDEVMAYGLPDLAAEAIALRFPDDFTSPALAAARTRLEEAGFTVGARGELTR